VRHARRQLQERAAAGKLPADVETSLLAMFAREKSAAGKLRALWALRVTGHAGDEFLARQLNHDNEHVRWWAVQLLCEDRQPEEQVVAKFAEMAAEEDSPLVRLALASVLQRMPLEQRWDLAAALASHAEDARDQNLPLMIWYGIEPAVAADSKRALALAAQCKIPLVVQNIARRIAEK
jgi:hypothetical protein